MVTLVIVKNPFEPWNGREIKKIVPGDTVQQLLSGYQLPGLEMMASVNGYTVAPETVIQDNDLVVICPVIGKGGKNILGLIASIVLSVVAFGVGSAVMGGAMFGKGAIAMSSWGFGAYAAAAAVMFIGNTLIGRAFGAKADTGKYEGTTEATYSWNGVSTMEGQNNAVALTYGTVMSGGQSIAKNVQVIDNEEYLNWLVAAGEGPLVISDIKINDNDVAYYSGMTVDVREGTNTQDVIPNFNDTFFTKTLGYQLLETERIDTAQGNATEGLAVKVEFNGGLYYANDEGGLSEAWVKLWGCYRRGTDGEWIPFVCEKSTTSQYVKRVEDQSAPYGNYTLHFYRDSVYDPYDQEYYTTNIAEITYPDGTTVTRDYAPKGKDFTLGYFVLNISDYSSSTTQTFSLTQSGLKITGSQTSALRREFRVDGLPAGEYYVKMQVTGRSHAVTNSRAAVRCYWTSLTSIVYDDFCYPNIALIGIRALATDQISGSPTLKFKKTCPYVWVWNPYTGAYVQKASNNPAWAAYDALHQCKKLEDPNNRGHFEFDVRGVEASRINYDQFNEWAAFCDSKRLYINIELNTVGEMLEVINQNIANVGRGMVIPFGTKYGCIWDCAKQPVQMFGMGNICAGTFQEDFLPTNDRANAVELTYMDAENDFNRETITIYGDNYDDAATEKVAQATFNGITSYEQAYREGMYQLYCNKYQVRTVSFEANIDAIACTIGDVILVAHDVPKWAKSGRIEKVEGQELLLPVELEDTSGNYRIQYRTVNDNLYTSAVTILENKDGWCRVEVATPFGESDPPQRHDIFDLAISNVGSKPFVVKSITRAQDFTRRISGIEYNENLYNEDYDIPEIDYSSEDARPKNVTNVSATKYSYLTPDGVTRYKMDVSWERASTGRFTVFVSEDGEDWRLLVSGLSATEYSADVDAGTGFVKITTTNGAVITCCDYKKHHGWQNIVG